MIDCGLDVYSRGELEVVGADGRIVLADPWHAHDPRIVLERGFEREIVELSAADSYRLELEDIGAAIRRRARAAARARRCARPGAHDRGALSRRRDGRRRVGRALTALSSRAVAKKKKDPIKELLADITPALFLGNPSGTVAIMQDKVEEAGGDLDEVLEWVREHGGYPDRTFGVRARQGFDMRPKAPSKYYFVVPEDALK